LIHKLAAPDAPTGARSGQALNLPADSPLRVLAAQSPALVIFLRSFGCTFCREAMADVAAARDDIRATGAEVAFVHGGSAVEADRWFAKYGLGEVTRISDPALVHYRAFGLGRTSVQALVDPKVWTRGAVCALSHGFGAQTPEMMRQLPGIFVVQGDRILAEYRHRSPADRPDYLGLVREAATPTIDVR
jgi:peroxiredoxin